MKINILISCIVLGNNIYPNLSLIQYVIFTVYYHTISSINDFINY